jgi:hypothetical protein
LLSSSRQSEIIPTTKKPHHLAGKEFVRIITRDGVRDLLVPSSKPNAYTEFWPERELSRLQAKAKVMTVEDKMQELRLRLQSNEKLKAESEKRKQKLREIDTAKVAKMEDKKESFVDESENVKLLDRAFLAKQERVSWLLKVSRFFRGVLLKGRIEIILVKFGNFFCGFTANFQIISET